MVKVREIIIYPVKGMRGIAMDTATAMARGFANDRRFMLVDRSGKFISQRTNPDLIQFKLELHNDGLKVSYPYKGEIVIPLNKNQGHKTIVNVWGTSFTATLMPEEYHDYFSDCLEGDFRLVTMLDDDIRQKDMGKHGTGQVSFADGYPYLILGTASHNDLNMRLEKPVPINRFRANIILETEFPFEEDHLSEFMVGGAAFKMIKPCIRCQVITIDQNTGISSKEPSATLSKYRKSDGGIVFGMNAICTKFGNVTIGATVVQNEA